MDTYAQLVWSRLVVDTGDGPESGIVIAAERGRRKNHIDVVLLMARPVRLHSQCRLTLNGNKLGAVCSRSSPAGVGHQNRLKTIVPDENFWK